MGVNSISILTRGNNQVERWISFTVVAYQKDGE